MVARITSPNVPRAFQAALRSSPGSGTAANPVDFTSDARKTIGWAIGDAEKTVNAGKLTITPGASSNQVRVRRFTLGTSGCLRLQATASQRPVISRNPLTI